MAGLILTPRGIVYKIPECECKRQMLPKDLVLESGIWKCPYCMKEKETKSDKK